MILDLFNKWKMLISLNINYPKFFSTKFSIYRYALVFGLTNRVKVDGKSCFMSFGDYEDKPLKDLYRAIRKKVDDEKLGIVFIFQSSKGKYHFLAPKLLDSFAESIHVSSVLGSHKEYLNFSALKGLFALRLTKKHHKDEPKMIGVIFGTKTEGIRISSDFVNLMKLNYGFHPSNFDLFNIVPSELEFTKYNTYNL